MLLLSVIPCCSNGFAHCNKTQVFFPLRDPWSHLPHFSPSSVFGRNAGTQLLLLGGKLPKMWDARTHLMKARREMGPSGSLQSLLPHCRDGPITFLILGQGESYMAISLSSHSPCPSFVFLFASSCSKSVPVVGIEAKTGGSSSGFPPQDFHSCFMGSTLRGFMAARDPSWLRAPCCLGIRLNPQSLQEAEKWYVPFKWMWTCIENLNIFTKLTSRNVSARRLSFLLQLNIFYFSYWDTSWQEGTDFVWLQQFPRQLI